MNTTPIQQKSNASPKLISRGRVTRRQAKNDARQERDRPWKPPGHVQDHKLIGRHAEEIVRLIREPAQVSQPFGSDITKIMREMPLRPDVPGRHDQKKNQRIFPPQKRAKSYPRFAIKNREQNKNHSGINNAKHLSLGMLTQRKSRHRRTTAPMAPALIAAYSAEHRASHECGDERFGHNNAREKKRAAKAEIDQTCDETAPVI
jgi:hypothetical protein